MNAGDDARVLRIYVGEADKHGHEALYKHLVLLLRQQGAAGVTVTRGIMGYGARSVIHATSPLRLSQDLPVVLEVVDTPARIEALLPHVARAAPEAFVVTFDAQIRRRA